MRILVLVAFILSFFFNSRFAHADVSPFLDPLQIWSKSIVKNFRSDAEGLQFKVKELTPLQYILKYHINELDVDQSSHLSGPYSDRLTLTLKMRQDPSSYHVIQKGDLYYPYKIVQRRSAQDSVTGYDYLYATDQWDREDRLKGQSYDPFRVTFKTGSGDTERLFELESGVTVSRILINKLNSNSSHNSDNTQEVLEVDALTDQTKECAFRQFENFSQWIQEDSNRAKTLKLLGVDLSLFEFKVLNLSSLSQEKIKDALFLEENLANKKASRYIEQKDFTRVLENIAKHLDFGFITSDYKTRNSAGIYEWAKESRKSLRFQIALLHEDAYLQLPHLENYGAYTIASGVHCLFNRNHRINEVVESTVKSLSSFTQYRDLIDNLNRADE